MNNDAMKKAVTKLPDVKPDSPEKLLVRRELEAEAIAEILGRQKQLLFDEVSAVGDRVNYIRHGRKYQLVVHTRLLDD